MHLCFFVTETCKFDALDKRLKSGDVFDQTQEKKPYHLLFLLWYYCFTSHDAKTRLFCKIIVLQSTAITSTDSILFRPPPPDFTENIMQQQSLKQFVFHGSCIWKIAVTI